ncbi:hypothetical protein EW145_g3223 [Phellinidium pouzarii]|uniref:Uncharacterized protein n=1 Tax=Phellinidium pouzarii TaxID=167371 RepID=A0A4S4LDD4_9AGAM|nr:hypothetical protein EW145_g3223 [Phellinidium pouzarii]
MKPIFLHKPSPDDEEWHFTIDHDILQAACGINHGKVITFTADAIQFGIEPLQSNRVLQTDDSSKFVLAHFGSLRFPNLSLSLTAKYIQRMLDSGLYLNGVQYRFYHHSPSQLRSRSCYLREAGTDQELDHLISQLGSFDGIHNIAKRAKRIGLLFSSTAIGLYLDVKYTADIPDIESGGELFSDGCGLVSRHWGNQLSKHKGIVFRNRRYTPSIFQIRYLGYKGVVMLHPPLDVMKKHLVAFRKSMKKFSANVEPMFSVIDFSTPYSFGRLNNDVVVLLSSLGVSNEKLLEKQEEYFQWLIKASDDVPSAINFLSCLGQYALSERILLDGIESSDNQKGIHRFLMQEVKKFKKDGKMRVRMMVHKSRLLYGVCDPFKVLKEGQIFVRVSDGRRGQTTLANMSVLVARNPCLHPGDCLKLQAVHSEKLEHLVDCIVFASVGRRAAPSMISGGDLDGDRFFVCWDPNIIPSKVAESYNYPPNKEHTKLNITRQDLVQHFASYNTSGLAKVALLHQKWARYAPGGAMSPQCQELNALHSKAVDGARIEIPDRLQTPPTNDKPHVIDVLTEAASKFAETFLQNNIMQARSALSREDADSLMIELLKSKQRSLSEFELLNLARTLAHKYQLDLSKHLLHVDFSSLTTQEKYELCTDPYLSPEQNPYMWNSLVRSDIVSARDLADRNLEGPLRLQRLYSSEIHGMSSFFEYLRQGVQDFTRKVLIIRSGHRFAIGVFIRGEIPWDEDSQVNDNVVVCAFLSRTSESMSAYRPCTEGYRLYCGDNLFQLYNKQRGDTFIFLGARRVHSCDEEIITSIALQKISQRVQKQIGRINKTQVTAIEIHVVSNRDRVSQRIFDLRFDQVPTEEFLPRFPLGSSTFVLRSIQDVDWSTKPSYFRKIFLDESAAERVFTTLSSVELDQFMDFAIAHRADKELFLAFERRILSTEDLHPDTIGKRIEQYPSLVYALLKRYPPNDAKLPTELDALVYLVVRNVIRCANAFSIACLTALEKIKLSVASLPVNQYLELLMLASLGLRARNLADGIWLAQEVMFILHEARAEICATSMAAAYIHKHALAVAINLAEEAAEECPCNEKGQLAKQNKAPTRTKLFPVEEKTDIVSAHIRIDAGASPRLHSHVRLRASSDPENDIVERVIIDGKVTHYSAGELRLELIHPLPPEYKEMEWDIYDAGSIATTNVMMSALQRLESEKSKCCRFYSAITGSASEDELAPANEEGNDYFIANANLNESQIAAIDASKFPLNIVWGPPGTGKTTVMIEILRKFLHLRSKGVVSRILMAASTHNAVDNVLERFRREKLLEDGQILRVATEMSKVNKDLQYFSVDARIGGDMYQDQKLRKEADRRVKEAVIVFTTCTGAGLGTLRNLDFDTVLVDEASQITEACALIPLVKGCKRAVIVGDHVQLRPTVKPLGKALDYDISLLERLYTGDEHHWVSRTMLDVQYRFPERLARFPSSKFYNGRLRTGVINSKESLSLLTRSVFPWPKDEYGSAIPALFVPCSIEENMGKSSKVNKAQVMLVAHIVSLLKTPAQPQWTEDVNKLSITALSPYLLQVQELRDALPSSTNASTVDGFQGREDDIIILSTVRSNVSHRIGFLNDERRLNVAWTRAKLALIIVGDKDTLSANPLWKDAISACDVVNIQTPTPRRQ